MKDINLDPTRIDLLLNELRLPATRAIWQQLAEQTDREGWPAARFLFALAEHELAERDRRRIERHLAQARLLPGKTLDTFEFEAVPMISGAQVRAIVAGDSWLDQGANLLLFGPPGSGKSHLAAAIGRALIENGYKVLFTRTTDLVQKLQLARSDLALESALAKLDRFHLLILDDIACVTRDQAETSVLFELISTRYERRSVLITALRRMGQDLPGPRHDRRCRRPPRPSLQHLRTQRRKLPAVPGGQQKTLRLVLRRSHTQHRSPRPRRRCKPRPRLTATPASANRYRLLTGAVTVTRNPF